MKRSWLLYLVILVLTVFSSCSSTLYKHRLMLESCHTRDDVLRRLGLPDEKIYTKTAEEWVYNLDSHQHEIAAKSPLPVTDSLDTGKVINYDKQLKFTFNLQGKVTCYQSNIADPVKAIIRRDEHVTAFGIFGAVLFLALIIYIDTVTKSEISL